MPDKTPNGNPAPYQPKPAAPIAEIAQWLRQPLLDKIAMVCVAALLLLVGARSVYQWDFAMFVDSARQYAMGQNPYRGSGLSFFHPPITLYLYGLFTHFPPAVAKVLWFALHLVGIAALLVLWNRHFVVLEARWPTIVFLMLGHSSAIYSDLVAGNVSTFEQLGMWLAFTCLLTGRYAWFCVLLALSSQFKLTPVLFSALLVVVPPRREWGWLVATVALFAAMFMLNRVLDPRMWELFWSSAQQLDERGWANAAMLPLLRDLLDLASAGSSSRTLLDEGAYLVSAAAVGLVSLVALLRYRDRAPQFDRALVICFACLVYALVLPRFKDYSAILLLIPTLYLVRSPWRTHLVPIGICIIGCLVLFPRATSSLPIRAGFALFQEYVPLFARFAIWGGYLMWMRQACTK